MQANLGEPSERDYEVFCAVEWDGVSLRAAAAKKWQISPTRVGQVVDEVKHWYRTTMPTLAEQGQPRLDAVCECHMHNERLQHLYGLAMASWRASKGEAKSYEKAACGGALSSAKSFGDTRYLALAARLSHLKFVAAENLADAIEKYRKAQEKENAPPEVGCAPKGAPTAVGETAAAEVESLTSTEEDSYDDDDDGRFADFMAEFAEKTPERAREDAPAAAAPVPLSRKARRKMLAQKLRGKGAKR